MLAAQAVLGTVGMEYAHVDGRCRGPEEQQGEQYLKIKRNAGHDGSLKMARKDAGRGVDGRFGTAPSGRGCAGREEELPTRARRKRCSRKTTSAKNAPPPC